MKKLLKKMKKQAEVAEPSPAVQSLSEEHLDQVFEHHSLDKSKFDGFYTDLSQWKKQL